MERQAMHKIGKRRAGKSFVMGTLLEFKPKP